jgi:hypothetical protein
MGSNLLFFFCYLDFAFNNVKDFYQNLYCKGVTMLRTSIKIYIAKVSHKGCRWYFMGFLKVSKWERVHFVTLKIIIFVLFTINLWNQDLSPLTLWVWIPLMVRWFSSVTLVFSKNKINHHDIAEILLKVAWNIITLPVTVPSTWIRYQKIGVHMVMWNHY